MLRILRGLADGSCDGLKVGDLYRLQFETVMYIDKDGVVSSTSGYWGPGTRAGTKFKDAPAQLTVPLAEKGAEQLNTEYKETSGVKPVQPNEFSPIDFLAKSTSFSFGTPPSSLTKDEGSNQPSRVDGSDTSLLSMGLMVYNNLVTDIGGTTRFFDQDFRNSVLFGSTPTTGPPAPEDTRSAQGMESQSPSAMSGCVPFDVRDACMFVSNRRVRYWERALYDNRLGQIPR